MPDNFCVFVVPGPQDDEDPDLARFMFATCENDMVTGSVTISDLEQSFPENWENKYKVHLWEIMPAMYDMVRHPDFAITNSFSDSLEARKVTHVALVEGSVIPEGSHPLRFAGALVKGNSMLLLYDANNEKYILFETEGEAFCFAKWLEFKQPEWWDAESSGFQDPRKTYN